MKKIRSIKIVRKTVFVFRQDQQADWPDGDPTLSSLTITSGGTRLVSKRRSDLQ
ncbi:hypothetical protein [Pedobacter foliorum]|uniref:hypothetical protein n=1 Tax=Pedobacter foliorum TaxID=2739058 RepID=UPI001566F071|nr:hypothetical protein [Pedobacter foliorum]NRF41115.1 hypothetical protein [Pedobacter foliorum]